MLRRGASLSKGSRVEGRVIHARYRDTVRHIKLHRNTHLSVAFARVCKNRLQDYDGARGRGRGRPDERKLNNYEREYEAADYCFQKGAEFNLALKISTKRNYTVRCGAETSSSQTTMASREKGLLRVEPINCVEWIIRRGVGEVVKNNGEN